MEEFSTIEPMDLLISKYLSGNATSAEAGELLNWLKLTEENQSYFTHYKLVWLQTELFSEKSIENKWEQLQIRMAKREQPFADGHEVVLKSRSRFLSILRYAAMFIVIFGLSALAYTIFRPKKDVQLLTENVIEVPYGSKMSLILPDRSRVWINSGSKIIYNNKFGIDNRSIQVIGEAYFDVAKNPKLPFIVHAGNVNIKAVGTSFNVKAYPEENKVETTLIHGSVEVKKDGEKKQILLKPSEKIVIFTRDEDFEKGIGTENSNADIKPLDSKVIDTEIAIKKEINVEKETAWKDGKLIFEGEPLELLTVELMRKYDVTFEFEDLKLRSYKFSGTFRDIPLEQIMDAIKFSSPIDYEIIEKKVIIKEKLK